MSLKSDLIDSFKNIRYPDNEELTPSLAGKCWESITLDDLIEFDSFDECLCCLNPKAFHYYAPGMMKLILDNHEEADMLPHAFLRRFAPTLKEELSEAQETIRQFNNEQRRVLIDFMNYLKTFDVYKEAGIDTAIENIKLYGG